MKLVRGNITKAADRIGWSRCDYCIAALAGSTRNSVRGARLTMKKAARQAQTRFALGGGTQSAVLDRLDVGRRMHQRQLAVAGRQRLLEADHGTLQCQSLTQAPVLGHGKSMPRRQRQDELGGVEDMHAPIVALAPRAVAGSGF